MSRIGRKPIVIPQGVKVQVVDGGVSAEGPKGKLVQPLPPGLSAKVEGTQVVISRAGEDRKVRALHGLARSLVQNMGTGVKAPFEEKQEGGGRGEMITKERRVARDLRHRRVRRYVRGSAARPRLAVFRSLNHIYAQLIDDDAGRTLLAVDSRSKAFRAEHRAGGNIAAAKVVGALLAQHAKGRGIERVVFDRGGYKDHRRGKALSDPAPPGGLVF